MSQIVVGVQVQFASDWHIGAGSGQPGHLDRIVRRDPLSGLPFVPAKTLIGMLRDGGEAVAAGLGERYNWTGCLDALFGDQPARPGALPREASPLPARLDLRPGVYDAQLSAHLCADPLLKDALTFAKPGVWIDPSTGAAQDDMLRMDETVRGGCTLVAAGILWSDDLKPDQALALQALLWAAGKATRRIGGKRRRGVGQCTIAVTFGGAAKRTQPELIRRLESRPPTIPARKHQCAAPHVIGSGSPGVWWRVPLTLELKTPVVIPSGVFGNVVESRDFIPGTLILGVIAKAVASVLKGTVDDSIARGDIRVLNAYPEVNGARGIPVPMSFHCHKDSGGLDHESGEVLNLAAGTRGAGLRPHRDGFIDAPGAGNRPTWFNVELSQTTHNTVDDERQRPAEEVGGVYTYQALPAGLRLRSEIHCRESVWNALCAESTTWWSRLDGEIRLGIAKKDDYGLVRLSAGTASAGAPARRVSQMALAAVVTLWLASDLLARNPALRPDPTPASAALLLQRELRTLLREPAVTVTLRRAFARTRRSEGWHTRWQLPRPSYIALQAGSVLQFEVTGASDDAALADALVTIEQQGMGERRAEGLGEVYVNHHVAVSVVPAAVSRMEQPQTLGQASPSSSRPLLQAAQPDLAKDPTFRYGLVVESAAWRDAIQHAALSWAVSDDRRAVFGWELGKPSNAKLGALRSLLVGLRTESNITRIVNWLDKSVAARKWERAGADAVAALMGDSDAVWQRLAARSTWPATIVTPVDALRRNFKLEAVRALLLAAIQAETRARERDESRRAEAARV